MERFFIFIWKNCWNYWDTIYLAIMFSADFHPRNLYHLFWCSKRFDIYNSALMNQRPLLRRFRKFSYYGFTSSLCCVHVILFSTTVWLYWIVLTNLVAVDRVRLRNFLLDKIERKNPLINVRFWLTIKHSKRKEVLIACKPRMHLHFFNDGEVASATESFG